MSDTWAQTDMERFQEAVQSLKLYRRAELTDPDQGSPLIEELYVDPLPQQQIFNTVKRAHTTFLIGRKGTGKSTIFQRLQSELRKSRFQTSAYIDIKTVYESSQIDSELLVKLQSIDSALPKESLEKLLLHRKFLHEVIKEIKEELKKRLKGSIWGNIKEFFSGSIDDLNIQLDELYEDISSDNFMSVLGVKSTAESQKSSEIESKENSGTISGEISATPNVKVKLGDQKSSTKSNESYLKQSDILIRSFNVKDFINRLKDILALIKIKHLHILVDDFSELPEETMKIVVDVLLAPLNNWSDEFIKFKIAAYPGRIYYGQIDKSKIDEVYLDLYNLYGSGDVNRMEESAVDFTTRLVKQRVSYFCGKPAEEFFENNHDEIWKTLFFSSMANPRTLGYILHFVQDSHLIRGKKIGVVAIQEAAQRFYTEKIESYFSLGRFLHESFDERSSIYSLKELLEALVTKARELRSYDAQIMRKIHGRRPTSHFHTISSLEKVFSTLELNFFITKYFEMSDRSGRKVVIFALNYGLCTKYQIAFGRPVGEREFRLYFVERFFDFSGLVDLYLQKNQEIVCTNCGYKYSLDQLEALMFYSMKCKECETGKVEVKNLSKKYATEISSINIELLLPETEIGILQSLHFEKAPLRPNQIAAELDCSYQLIGKRGVILQDKRLIDRTLDGQNNRIYKITEEAEKIYFSETGSDLELDADEGMVTEK